MTLRRFNVVGGFLFEKPNMKTWSSKQIEHNVVMVDVPVKQRADWEWWLLLTSDHHLDSPKCNRELLKKHLQEAVNRNAGIHFNGDVLDLMQGVGDKRASKSELLRAYCQDDDDDPRSYLDRVVDDAAEFYKPFAKNIICISEGNHEDSVIKRCETNVLQRLVGCLNKDCRTSISAGTYEGWIKFGFYEGKNNKGKNRRYRDCRLIHYHHGYGGGNQKIMQRAALVPQADICISGHTHDFEVGKEWGQDCITSKNKTFTKNQTHIILPTYKDDKKGGRGFAVKNFHKTKVLGAVWCRFYWDTLTEKVLWQTMQAR